MIERKLLEGRVQDYKIKEFLKAKLENVGFSKAEIEKTPLGVKVTIYSSKPGLIVGKGGDSIKELTHVLETEFKMQNPQIEIEEISKPDLDSQIIAEDIVYQLKRFGKSRFKAIGYRSLQRIMRAGAIGAEVTISGRIPGQLHKTWRFKIGRLPKCGNVAQELVHKGFKEVQWNQGTIGVKVTILRPDVKNPDIFKLAKEEKHDIKKE